MDRNAIGVFDSGLGGLTAVKELNRILPNENIIYFGDTARIPYGTRSRETVLRYAREDVAFLRRHPVKMIIAACGTVSSVIGTNAPVDDMPFSGVLYPAAEAACALTQNGRIGVIGTPATIRSGSYEHALHTINNEVSVTAMACPLFVHLVEYGYTNRDNQITRLAAEEYLAPIRSAQVDTLILGCTHYPIIRDIIADIMGEGVNLISPGEEAAKYAKRCLEEQDLLTDSTEKGKNIYYVSDSVSMFRENARHFLEDAAHGQVFSSRI
ncbi:MAG: glutamate racemase [Oscillospiraceae bacterium]|nr:glutamate racemase [Ruminococcus sp.]MBQ7003648.1 glutamate racemase [Oscillospiraceae bacterium]MBQ7013960.1 glutamate racemase [Oscillospiraceae bacterium]